MTGIQETLDKGLGYHRAGRLEDAADCYHGVLAAEADNPEAHHLLGVVALQSGKPTEAVERFTAAIKGEPGNAKYLGNLGAAYLAEGRPSEALGVLENAIESDPDSLDILCNLAAALRSLRRFEDALAAYGRALDLAPDDPAISAGIAATNLGLTRSDDALTAVDRAIALDENNGEWRNVRGGILLSMARYDDAVSELETAVRFAPDLVDGWINLGLAYQNVNRLDDSERTYRDAVDRWPESPSAYAGLGRTQRQRGNLDAAIANYRRAVELNPGNARAHSSLLFNLLGDPNTDAAELFQAHRDWNTRHASSFSGDTEAFGNESDPDRSLRIGYVSADFREHPVGRLVLPILMAHDRSSVEIVAYSQADHADKLTDRIAGAVDLFQNISSHTDEALTSLIRDDNIDILVDLSGHSARNRLTVFTHRPAPVQATWLGYMSSTGLEAMDYLIGDPVHTPVGDDSVYSEKIKRLPHDLLCFDPPDDFPDVVASPCMGTDAVTFGCFNNPGKITSAVLASWAEILNAVPQSQLYLRYTGYEDPGVQRDFRDRLGALGIARSKVRFAGKAPYQDVLSTYGDIDIALDTSPYSGTMTTLEALWMGVPVIARAGDRMVARQAAAHLTAAGLGNLVANDAEAYVDLAISLANDRERLVELRGGMRDRLRATPLCDVAGFTRSLERLYRDMWHDWCSSPPQRR